MSGSIEISLQDLNALPELDPPADLERETLSAMADAAAAAERTPWFALRDFAQVAAWLAALGIGSWLVVEAVSFEEPVEIPATAVTDQIYIQLAQQSMQLEEMLALMPPPRRVMRADTASTIVGLEDRIAVIDAALFRTDSRSAPRQYREALMRDRVEVMNALVNVRYAQSQAFVF